MPTAGVPAHDHDCADADCGVMYSLYKHIDTPLVTCLNEESEGSCQRVFKPWEERTDFSGEPLSFSGEVRLKAFSIIGGPDGASPATVRLYPNRQDLDFGLAAEMPPAQTFTLAEDFTGVLEYPMLANKFQNVWALDMYFPETFGASQTEIYFVGIKGEYIQGKREAVTAVYEVKPMPGEHKIPGAFNGVGASNLGM